MSILVFGDSIGQGAFDPTYNGWVSLLAAHQWKKILDTEGEEGHEVFNVSVSGDTTEDLLRRIESDVKTRGESKKGKIAVLAIGTNDAATVNGVYQVDFDQYKKNINKIFNTLEQNCEQIIITGFPSVFEEKSSPWCFDETASWKNADLDRYESYQIELAKEKNLLFLPMSDVLDETTNSHLPDGVHPNTEGHRLLFDRVKETLEKEGII